MEDKIESGLQRLKEKEKRMLRLAGLGMQADDGAMYPFDFWTNAATNRGIQLSSGFRSSIKKRNAICSGALLRLQIDTALRFSTGWLVKDPHGFVGQIMNGEQINKIKDCDGNLMTDRYLVKRMAQEHPWIEEVYRRTSGYVHFSDVHIWSTLCGTDRKEGQTVTTKVGARDREGLSELYLEMVTAFEAATEILVNYVEGWVYTKQVAALDEKTGGS